MKILYISHQSLNCEGAVIALYNIVKVMRRRGHDITVLFPSQGKAVTMFEELGVKCLIMKNGVLQYPAVRHIRGYFAMPYRIVRTMINNYICDKKLASYLRTENFDIVHSNTSVLGIGKRASRWANVKYVCHIREIIDKSAINFHMFPSNTMFYRSIRTNNYNICITKAVCDFYKLDSANSTIIYDGVFDLLNKPTIQNKKQPYFVSIGGINTCKDPMMVLEGFAKFANKYPNYELWYVGKCDGQSEYEKYFLNRIKELNVGDRVKVLGTRNDVYDILSNSSGLIAGSKFEGFGFTVVEAMLNGCTVFGRNSGGIKEQFDRGFELTGKEIGIRFMNEIELSERLSEYASKGRPKDMETVEDIQQFVYNQYSATSNAISIENIYKKLLNK